MRENYFINVVEEKYQFDKIFEIAVPILTIITVPRPYVIGSHRGTLNIELT